MAFNIDGANTNMSACPGSDDCTSDSQSYSYDAAVAALYSSEHQACTTEAMQRAAARRKQTIADMREYMNRIQLTLPRDMSFIHISGTKGKGSTACFCESILRERYGLTTGLFTSPHLVDIRERIRIGGKPVSKNVFAEAYFKIRQQLEKFPDNTTNNGDTDGGSDGLPQLPGYFRMLTLLGIYIFANYNPQINVVILEVGIGGRYDATNAIFDLEENDGVQNKNVVCGITQLDLDHTRVLGTELEQIAWEKGGIFKVHKDSEIISKRPDRRNNENEGVLEKKENTMRSTEPGMKQERNRFFSIGTNTPTALSVLHECAKVEGRGQELNVIHEGQAIPLQWKLGLDGMHQRINAELANSLCEAIMEQMPAQVPSLSNISSSSSSLREYQGQGCLQQALSKAIWPGRCQTVSCGNISIPTCPSSPSSTLSLKVNTDGSATNNIQMNLRCDGAHTQKSIESGLSWFQSVSASAAATLDSSTSTSILPMTVTESSSTPTGNDIVYRVLIFNCSHERNPIPFLKLLRSKRQINNHNDKENDQHPLFDAVYFCRTDACAPSMVAKSTVSELFLEAGASPEEENVIRSIVKDNGVDDNYVSSDTPTWQDTLAQVWSLLGRVNISSTGTDNTRGKRIPNSGEHDKTKVFANLTVKEAIDHIKKDTIQSAPEWTLQNNTHNSTGLIRVEVCVTGSLYLVGSALDAIGWTEDPASGTLNSSP